MNIDWNNPEKYLNSNDSQQFIFEGNLPILLSVPHDGHMKEIIDEKVAVELSRVAPKEKRDGGVKYLAWEIAKVIGDSTGKYPSLVIQQIHRQYINNKIRNVYYQNVLQMASRLSKKHGEVFVLDLHGFSKESRFAVYDMVFGTLHRQTINRFNYLDVGFCYYLGLEGEYKIYLPNEIEFRGEMYTGNGKNNDTVIKHLSTKFQAMEKSGDFIQIEIHKRFRGRSLEEIERGKILASHFARAIINLFAGFKMIPKAL